MKQEYWQKSKMNQINYLEINRKRYFNVCSAYKYTCIDNNGDKHYYLARNRKELDDVAEERKLTKNRKKLDDKINEFKQK